MSEPLSPSPTDLRDRLARCRAELSAARSLADALAGEQAVLQARFATQQQHLDELAEQHERLATHLAALESWASTSPSLLGVALGNLIDSIQRGLLGLPNRQVDFAVAELSLEGRASLQLGPDGSVLVRLPAIDEAIPDQNLGRIVMELRPIPKAAQPGGLPAQRIPEEQP